MKDLQSVKSVIEYGFDQFEFMVDLPDPDATLKVLGAELKKLSKRRSISTHLRKWMVCLAS